MATLNETLTTLADNIRAKTGGTSTLSLAEMATAVASITTGGISGVSEFDSGSFTLEARSYQPQTISYSLSKAPDFLIVFADLYPYIEGGATNNVDLVSLILYKDEDDYYGVRRSYYGAMTSSSANSTFYVYEDSGGGYYPSSAFAPTSTTCKLEAGSLRQFVYNSTSSTFTASSSSYAGWFADTTYHFIVGCYS